jgi:hypothetical protein
VAVDPRQACPQVAGGLFHQAEDVEQLPGARARIRLLGALATRLLANFIDLKSGDRSIKGLTES